MMIDVSKRNLSTMVLGSKVLVPIGISPTAMQRMAHPDGECASAKAAEKAGTVFILSTISTSRLVFQNRYLVYLIEEKNCTHVIGQTNSQRLKIDRNN